MHQNPSYSQCIARLLSRCREITFSHGRERLTGQPALQYPQHHSNNSSNLRRKKNRNFNFSSNNSSMCTKHHVQRT